MTGTLHIEYCVFLLQNIIYDKSMHLLKHNICLSKIHHRSLYSKSLRGSYIATQEDTSHNIPCPRVMVSSLPQPQGPRWRQVLRPCVTVVYALNFTLYFTTAPKCILQSHNCGCSIFPIA